MLEFFGSPAAKAAGTVAFSGEYLGFWGG